MLYRHMTVYDGICRDIRVAGPGFQMRPTVHGHRHGHGRRPSRRARAQAQAGPAEDSESEPGPADRASDSPAEAAEPPARCRGRHADSEQRPGR
jgi:hypothetical protein